MTVLRDGRLAWEGKRDNSIYNEFYEEPFLRASERDYEQKANNWIGSKNCPEYLR